MSAEHRFWLRALPSFLAPREPGRFTRWLHGALVVPNVIFVSASAEYQAYLALIFHRSLGARFGHNVCVPLGALLMIATCARVHPLAGVGLTAIFAAWWALTALLQRRALWAVANVITAALLGLCGFVAARWLAAPWVWMLVVAALQAASHLTEQHVPPRVHDPERWVPAPEFIRNARGASIAQWLYGTFDEWWATPRLVPIGMLLVLFRLGYARDLRRRLDGYVGDAIASGDPALDYIGEGGGAYLDPATLEPRKAHKSA